MNDVLAVPIYIVDDDDSVREALSYVLEGYKFRVQDFASGEQFLEQVNLNSPGCLILDSRMPGLSGQQVHEILNDTHSCIKVMFLTSHGDVPMAVKAFREGACDFHQKPINAAELVPSIEKAQQGSLRQYRHNNYLQQYEELTAREKQLFDLVTRGLTNKQISETLCISVRTVEVHRSKMMEHLGAHNISELIKIGEALKEESN